ncbi:MAG: phosphoribosylformylglycinamidine synthase subunit PurQ [bacterium]|nr:MAG: phosphoribosylformylglycinamidine synthase subunit PurQ [bacterium]
MAESPARFGVVIFPGSNCERDTMHVIEQTDGAVVRGIWHKETSLDDIDVLILPGGFSYGDYLRCGAIARFSPIMKAVADFAKSGGVVVGICNGFQILVESGLLPGALISNDCLRFVCKNVFVRVERGDIPATEGIESGSLHQMPIAHHDGRYYADGQTLERLEANRQVVLRYCDENGRITPRSNPNGSLNNIAGICSEQGNVLGFMPHPERCAETLLGNGGAIGQKIFDALRLSATRRL